MAWIKEYTDPDTGVTASYWEVIGIDYRHREQLSTLQVGLWISPAAYAANKASLKTITYLIPAGLSPQLSAGALAFVTNYALAQAEFQGAELEQENE
jgi:hypothetical protein